VNDKHHRKPNWNTLYVIAGAQDGYFTTRQAANSGYSTQLLLKHIHNGRITRIKRGIYRLVHFPAGEHEELTVIWLWSERAGVFSHQTALSLHGLSDILPGQLHLTLPAGWLHRRFRVPKGVVLHHADVSPDERAWFGPVPATSPRQTLNDCAYEIVSPEILRQAAQQALQRGLVVKSDIPDVEKALAPFGGLAT